MLGAAPALAGSLTAVSGVAGGATAFFITSTLKIISDLKEIQQESTQDRNKLPALKEDMTHPPSPPTQ